MWKGKKPACRLSLTACDLPLPIISGILLAYRSGRRPPHGDQEHMSEELNKALSVEAAMKDKDADVSSKARPRRKRKVSYLTLNKIEVVDYKDVALLRKFTNDRGKMLPSRQTGTTARQQRQVAQAIKRAREMALIPFVVSEMNTEKREPRAPRGEAPVAATPTEE